jgi:hypothetical protein
VKSVTDMGRSGRSGPVPETRNNLAQRFSARGVRPRREVPEERKVVSMSPEFLKKYRIAQDPSLALGYLCSVTQR